MGYITTAQHLIERINQQGGFHTIKKKSTGWLLVTTMAGDRFDTFVNVLHDDEFIIMMPIGNKISSSFFSPNDREELLAYFKTWIDTHSLGFYEGR